MTPEDLCYYSFDSFFFLSIYNAPTRRSTLEDNEERHGVLNKAGVGPTVIGKGVDDV